MRKIPVFFCCLLWVVGCTTKTDYENKVEMHRSRTIAFFAEPVTSPLDSLELKTFKGLHFYPVNPSYKIEATLMWLPQTVFVELKRTGGDFKPYMKVAEIHFLVNGKSQKLIAYQTGSMAQVHELFVPFADPTNGTETYSGGRYLDVVYNPASQHVELDFNFAYAPYCAYTHHASCPLIPAENTLTEKILAGAKL